MGSHTTGSHTTVKLFDIVKAHPPGLHHCLHPVPANGSSHPACCSASSAYFAGWLRAGTDQSNERQPPHHSLVTQQCQCPCLSSTCFGWMTIRFFVLVTPSQAFCLKNVWRRTVLCMRQSMMSVPGIAITAIASTLCMCLQVLLLLTKHVQAILKMHVGMHMHIQLLLCVLSFIAIANLQFCNAAHTGSCKLGTAMTQVAQS